MSRRIWLIATMTAFFTLQAPLCVLACFESADAVKAVEVAEVADAVSALASQSCDAESPHSPPTPSGGESGSDLDCGCSFAPRVVISQADKLDVTPNPLFAESTPSLDLFSASVNPTTRTVYNGDLPPPDVLLLKSTLII